MIADKLTLSVVKAIENHKNCIVTADVDGTFDKRGSLERLVLTFYFSVNEEEVVQLSSSATCRVFSGALDSKSAVSRVAPIAGP